MIYLKDDDAIAVDLQMDKVLHLKELPYTFLSPQQKLQQH